MNTLFDRNFNCENFASRFQNKRLDEYWEDQNKIKSFTISPEVMEYCEGGVQRILENKVFYKVTIG